MVSTNGNACAVGGLFLRAYVVDNPGVRDIPFAIGRDVSAFNVYLCWFGQIGADALAKTLEFVGV